MKLIRNMAIATMAILTVSSAAICQSSLKNEVKSYNKERSLFPVQVSVVSELPKSSIKTYAKKDEKLQSTPTFSVLDTLFNSYSYFSNEQQPLVYHPQSGKLVTIMRGTNETVVDGNKDTKDNLFIRTSSDWGSTWSDPIMIYDATLYSNRMARYPSVYPLLVDGELSYLFTAPLTNNTGWNGFVNGLFNNSIPSAYLSTEFTYDGMKYGFLNDSKIVGYYSEEEYYGVAISGALPPGGTPWNKTSNIVQRFTEDFATWAADIPSGWASENFKEVTEDSTRSAMLVGLKRLENGKLYMAAYGNFIEDQAGEAKPVPAVSICEKFGQGWSNLVDLRMPYQIIKDFAATKGAMADSTFLTWGEKDFTVSENGDFSFVSTLYESRDTSLVQYEAQYHGIVEIYYKNNAWGIREIAQYSGYTTRYIAENQWTNNQMGSEIQVSPTVDGSKLVCKWVDFAIDDQGEKSTTDIFISVRPKDGNQWSLPINITNSPAYYDHISWMPDIVPNDLSKLPILAMKTLPIAGSTSDTTVNLTIDKPCAIICSDMADADISGRIKYPSEDVKDEAINDNMVISPNPAIAEAFISLNIYNDGNLNIEIFDAMGQRVSTIYNDFITNGTRAFRINTKDMSSGTYYIKAEMNNRIVTKTINILH